jgi:hypothetical protein
VHKSFFHFKLFELLRLSCAQTFRRIQELNNQTKMMYSPDIYKKQNYEASRQSPKSNPDDPVSKRMFQVDTLNVNKEKKTFFNKVEETDDYFPFGTPGGGAPLRNSNNDLVSKLPNINENLWTRYANKNEPNDTNQ